MAQTSIRTSMSGALAGQIGAELVPSVTFTAVVATGKTVTPGQPLFVTSVGPSGEFVGRPIENGDNVNHTTIGGIVRADTFRENEDGAGYGEGKSASVVRKGIVSLRVTDDVTALSPVYVGNATAQLGDITGAPGTGMEPYPGAMFLMSGAEGDLVPAYIDTSTPHPQDASAALTAINNHVADATEAHDASAIGYTAGGSLAATDVAGALDELEANTVALPSSLADGDILIYDSGSFVRLPLGSDGQVLTIVSGAPAWAAP